MSKVNWFCNQSAGGGANNVGDANDGDNDGDAHFVTVLQQLKKKHKKGDKS